MTTSQLEPSEIAACLLVDDLTDPASGDHAMQALLTNIVEQLSNQWAIPTRTLRSRPLVSIEDNYDRLGYEPAAVTRDRRYTRYTSDTTMLRSHTSAGVPPALRDLAGEQHPPADVLLVLPGLTYRRDVIDRLHVGTPHQLDLWRITRARPMTRTDLHDMIATLVEATIPGARWRTEPAEHPYTEHGRQVDVEADGEWVELAECGLAADHVLARAGLDPNRWTGLALGTGLDRALMLRKQIPDIRLLRAQDPRIAAQMLDLMPWRPVSMMPPVRRDLSIVAETTTDAELLGDRARAALGADADTLESLTVRAVTAHEQLPTPAQERLGTQPGQANLLVRVILRPVDSTLTDHQANALRDRIYAALHDGPRMEWATPADGGDQARAQP
ncbi:phenylalanyl-tRNA synthetase alpha subunit [Halopolyspora algeriensis]|uniref:Phenylalanyl-tRNA synthetase alpha subunit n=1 Tax=Halopolyspora algeriensis TaxID=1500506 RepID=A0A368VHK0_9ACTN|nr:hypothetical protein [Halopolyspora algeriensis]RCW39675.1 phenylalanyl-tRNA synthetase alpha subunit [Halopolyspora algeriensis]TQM54032.1 phenylalanyl-tRNA synthetase alpha subunit [Halopolyspora algeriensis]